MSTIHFGAYRICRECVYSKHWAVVLTDGVFGPWSTVQEHQNSSTGTTVARQNSNSSRTTDKGPWWTPALLVFTATCQHLSPSSTAVVTLQLGPVGASGYSSCHFKERLLIKMDDNCCTVSFWESRTTKHFVNLMQKVGIHNLMWIPYLYFFKNVKQLILKEGKSK